MSKFIFLIISTLLILTLQLNLILDKTNPIIFEKPSKLENSVLKIRFSFPTETKNELGPRNPQSPGLLNKQYFGLQFPPSLGSQLALDQGSLTWECGLSDGTYSYKLESVKSAPTNLSGVSIPGENNILYCQLNDDSVNVPLKIGSGVVYTLSIKLNMFPKSYMRGLSLFTSTSNTYDKIIIDSLTQIGSYVAYNDYEDYSTKALDIAEANVLVTNGSDADDNSIYPGTVFDINLRLSCTAYLTSNDHLIIIDFPSMAVSGPTSVTSSEVSVKDPTMAALKGSLSLRNIGENRLVIEGVSENLVPGRQFFINLKGFVGLYTGLEIDNDIKVYVYYKNTFTVVSYVNKKIIKVKRVSLSITANHPEFWDIYRNGAWPLKFTIIPNIDVISSEGFYVVIRQDNTLITSVNGGNIVTFVASTCDFSENSSFDNSFGKRASCFPLRLDHNYDNQNPTQTFKGSGFFFYFPGTFYKGEEFYVTVWIFADDCGGLSFNNIQGAASTFPNFEVSIHSQIKSNLLNEKRFNFDTAIALGTGRFLGKCWNNKIQSFTFNSNSGESINSADDNFKSDINDDVTANTPTLYLRFKEIFSWRIGSSSQSSYLNDISTNIEEKFLFSNSKGISSDSYFVAEADLNLATSAKLSSALPGSIQNNNVLPGSLTVQFSKNWFTGTDYFKSSGSPSKCYFSWALANLSVSSPNRKVLSIDLKSNTSASLTNFIGSSGHGASDFDESRSNLLMSPNVENSRNNIMRLVSKRNTADGNQKWNFFKDEVPSNKNTKVAWFTDCLNWKISNQVKSLFTYIDIQFIWTYSSGTNPNSNVGIFSNVRLIKLFPEGGVFHDKSKAAGNRPEVYPYVNHVVLSNPSMGIHASVCLVELNSKAISSVAEGNYESGVFAIWLGFGSLLETDYSDASATYPIGTLIDKSAPYGLQSQSPMNPYNLYVSKDYQNQNVPLYVTLSQLQNPITFGGSAGNPLKGQCTSSYHFLMGSLVLITGLTSKNIQTDPQGPLYIPYYCPYAYPDVKSDLRKFLNFSPSIFGAWLNMSNYSQISNLNRFLYYGDLDGTTIINKVTVLLSKTDTSSNIKLGAYKGKDGNASNIDSNKGDLGTLRWNTYTDTTNTVLNVFNGVQNKPNDPITCTGFSLFLNLNGNPLDSTLSFSIFTGKSGYYNSSKKFYVSGSPFTQAAFFGGISDGSKDITTSNIQGSNPKVNSASFQITGITRPSLESLINNSNQVEIFDKVGFSCAPADTTQYQGLTNYFYDDLNGRGKFLLDISPSPTGLWNVSIVHDKKDNYLADIAGKAKFLITSPSTIPIGGIIKLNSASFNQETLCGIVAKGSFTIGCENSEININCPVPFTSSKFTICCHNIKLTETLDLSVLKADFNAYQSNNDMLKYLTDYVYDAAPQISNSAFLIQTNNAATLDVINTKSTTISSVTYSQSNQVSGIGKITLTVTLPREPSRGMVLSVIGNLNLLLINGTTPRCHATFSSNGVFGSTWETGDFLIDACSFSLASNKIVITLKNYIYQCDLTLSKTLYISLWPVVLVDWNNNSIGNSFLVKLNDPNGKDLALNNQQFKLRLKDSLTNIPAFVGQWNSLCAVSSVTPKIPGEIADYLFNIDLDTNAAVLANKVVNEITIFWPFNLYGSYFANVSCYYNGTLLNCYFTDEGILNIKFLSALPIGSGNKIPIIVSGVPNPEVINDIIFACTINNINFATGERTNLITGSGLFTGGIKLSTLTANGSLRFMATDVPVSNTYAREVSTHRFRIAFDDAIGLTTIPSTLTTPIIFVYFPADYNLPWYSIQPSAIIDEYTNNDNKIISKTKTYTPASVVKSGNRIAITFAEVSIEFTKSFRYWEINLSNIPNPSDTTTSTDNNRIQTTSPYYVTLTNKEQTVLYNTITNVNTYSSDLFTGSTYNLLRWNRGNSFNIDNSRWIVDIYTDETQLNRLAIRPGRYSVANYRLRSNKTVNLNNASTTLSLTDNLFKISQSGYNIVTSFQQPINFLVGTPCGTSSGYYVINFALSDYVNFSPLSPVVVTVDSSIKGIISFKNPNAVPLLGSTWIGISINEYNFERLNINWQTPVNTINDPNSKITNLVIEQTLDISDTVYSGNRVVGYSVYSISSSQASKTQSYIASDPNDCWTFNGNNLLSIVVLGSVTDIPSDVKINPLYANANNDVTLEKNSIKLVFTPPINSVYLYCALVCFNSGYPVDADIIDFKSKNTSLLQFYKAFYNSNTSSNIIFRNLVRGQQYKLRCLIQSIHADPTKRSQATINLETPVLLGSPNNSISPIAPVPLVETQCIQWNFNPISTSAATEVLNKILNYCQNIFSNGGFFNNGCVRCTDSLASFYAPGLSSLKYDTCNASSRLRFLQADSSTANTNTATISSLNICAVPFPTCKSDVGPVKVYGDTFQQLIDNTKTNALFLQSLNINSIKLNLESPYITYSDANTPEITKLSGTLSSTNINGSFGFVVEAPSPLRCNWLLSANTTIPKWDDLKNCSTVWCGSLKVGKIQTTFSSDPNKLVAFEYSKTYNIYFGCVNDVPNPQKYSDIRSVLQFDYKKEIKSDPLNSQFLDSSMLSILLIITFIFN